MLHSAVLRFESLRTCMVQSGSGYHAYTMLLERLASRWPEVSELLHSDTRVKPLTVSPVMGPDLVHEQGLRLREGDDALVRFTCLDTDLAERLFDSVSGLISVQPIMLGGSEFRVKALATGPGNHLACCTTSFQELAESTPTTDRITVPFATPTTFRSQGRRNVVFPTPRLIFNSLLTRWSQLTSGALALPANPDEWLMVTRYTLATSPIDFGTYTERGFLGSCDYEFVNSADARLRRTVATLANFAYFSGICAKTTMGMRQS